MAIPTTTELPGPGELCDVLNECMRFFEPPPSRNVAEWAEQERVIAGASAKPGPYSFDNTPYWREVCELVGARGVDRVLVIGGSQTGKTEVELNVVGKYCTDEPSEIGVVLPKEGSASTWSTTRFDPMVEQTPLLREVFQGQALKLNGKRKRDSILEKTFPGGSIAFISAGTPNDLAMRPLRVLIFDESKSYQRTREGSPKAIVRARTRAFPNSIELEVTSPARVGSELHRDWEGSDMRRYFVPCPHCEEDQAMVWSGKDQLGRTFGVVWDKVAHDDGTAEHLPKTARYRCRYCFQDWTEAQRRDAVDAGHWEATNPRGKYPGFHVPALISKLITGLHLAASEFLACGRDPEALMAFENTWLAEFWDDVAEGLESDPLFARREPYTTNPVPEGVAFISCGCDVQEDRIEGTVIGWGPGEESWVLEHFVLPGPTQAVENKVWHELDLRLAKTYRHPKGGRLEIEAIGIDSGHHAEVVYRFSLPRLARNVWAMKGVRGADRELVPVKPSRNTSLGCPLWTVGVHRAKDTIYRRLALEIPSPPFIHFPMTLSEEYFAQLTAEEKLPTKSQGAETFVWRKRRPRNEALDCFVYGYAAMAIVAPDFETRARLLTSDPLRFWRGGTRHAPPDHPGLGRPDWLG